MISSSVTGILAQRLVRKLCSCHAVKPASPDFRSKLMHLGMSNPPTKMAVPIGCEKCSQTGYAGRIGIYELLRVDESIRNIIRTSGNVDQIRSTARANGMRLIKEDALGKVMNGTTTLEEILRVVPMESSPSMECTKCNQAILSTFNFCPNCGTRSAFKALSNEPRRRELVPEGV